MVQYESLLGIPWGGIGKRDCYALMADFFDLNFGIKLTDYARPSDWSSDETDLIRGLYERDGFEMITEWKPKDLRPADVLAFIIGEGNPNHLAAYLGDNTMIHHLRGRLSRTEPLMGFWRNHTAFILRHPDVPDLSPPKITMPLEDFIRARNHPETE